MAKQKTIGKEIKYSGIGLHTGNQTNVTFKPAPENYGIKFVRTDLANKPVIEANLEKVVSTARGTTLGEGEAKVHTVEHILASLSGLHIDNLIIELDANEPPVGDGSSMPFVEVLKKAEIVEQSADRNYFHFEKVVEYSKDDVHIIILPDKEFRITCTIDYKHPVLATESLSISVEEDAFVNEIAPSRTFCFDYEIDQLKRQGLAKGGSLDSAVVIGERKIHNTDKLRFENEFVRHKILDLVGDLCLVGRPIKGHIMAFRCGHASNIAFAKKLAKYIKQGSKGNNKNKEDLSKVPEGRVLDVNAIKDTIPHRYPFLFIDKIVVTEEDKKAVGFKNLTANEEFFNGHFPDKPIMPGVLIVEAMAQTSCVLFLSKRELHNKLAFFMGITDVKFRKPVLPGDRLRLDVEVIRPRARGGKVKGLAYVEGVLVAEAEFMFSLVDK